MKVPKYNLEYFGQITAPYIDWVAGGNFDGYLIQKSLKFIEQNNKVELNTKVVHKKNYDGFIEDSIITGSFRQTEKETLTLTFEHFEMRGKILGENEELIAFSILNSLLNKTEVYRLEE